MNKQPAIDRMRRQMASAVNRLMIGVVIIFVLTVIAIWIGQ
jgi:heme/copper-type cytochrome/quinol oxidase subunit 4